MRFMVIVKSDSATDAGAATPSDAELAEMGRYNETLVKAGVMLAGEGLLPSARGARVSFPDGKVTDGPFAESKELVAGFWIFKVKSKQEAIEWIRRAPFPSGEVEIRQIAELDDFEMSKATREQHESLQAKLEATR